MHILSVGKVPFVLEELASMVLGLDMFQIGYSRPRTMKSGHQNNICVLVFVHVTLFGIMELVTD